MKKAILIFAILMSMSAAGFCYQQTTAESCFAEGCIWEANGQYSQCEKPDCIMADNTNQSYCEVTMSNLLNMTCGWEIYGPNLCDPVGGDFEGGGCEDFDGNEQECYNTGYCIWLADQNICDPPMMMSMQNPSCPVINDQSTCEKITGCSWNNGMCVGNPAGVECPMLAKDLCSDFTLLSSCCNWNGTSCQMTFDNSCYDSVPMLPEGAMFCEDYASFKNNSLCMQIAGPPWFMPCKWDNFTSECHFNGAAFGSAAKFDEIGTKKGCEAQGGVWQQEQFVDFDGKIQTDSWCEFNFGNTGNCDAACWACEKEANPQEACENSDLGYCEFFPDQYAMNGVGWCNAKQEFIMGGAKSCSDDCAACEFMNEPATTCAQSPANCEWIVDSQAPNNAGFCYGKGDKHCSNDCFSCYDSTECATGMGGSNACTWDATNMLCKPAGFNGEICFDGIDNDNNKKVDCEDSYCSTNKFCVGDSLTDSFGNCPSYQDNSSCFANQCVWISGEFGPGFCDFPGAQCFAFDQDESECNNQDGCNYITDGDGFCKENITIFEPCFELNSTTCGAADYCAWMNEGPGMGGHCEPILFEECFGNPERRASQENCEANATIDGKSIQICGWDQFRNSCEPTCFVNEDSCTPGICEMVSGICEPEFFGGKCWEADGNLTKCNEMNDVCTYFPEPGALNSAGEREPSGYCDGNGDAAFVNAIGDSPPTILGIDDKNDGPSYYDITGVGLKEDFDKITFGIQLHSNFMFSASCKGIPIMGEGLGTKNKNYTFYWYMDTDGLETNNCAARDNENITGFEFSFKYQGDWSTELVENRVAYRCVNGSWAPAPVPLFSNQNAMCQIIGGGMAGIDKSEMSKFKGLFDKSKNMRIYTSVGDSESTLDVAGPYYYSPGSFDFKFEDCGNMAGDGDGDGLPASNDPDCFDFLKFGYVPNEAGFECNDNIDNDADGKTDCADEGCAYDPFFCGGSMSPDPNDKTAPKVKWQKVETFPDSAFVIYDANEPSNGSLMFYKLDNSCSQVDTLVLDVGIMDSFLPEYKLWHDGPLDNYQFNPQNLGYDLQNGTTYYYKTKICDISGNCAVSACLNFTTRSSASSCKSCQSTLNFPFAPQGSPTDPLGGLNFKFFLPDGSTSDLKCNAGAGKQLNYSQTKNFDLEISNPNASTQWCLRLINATIVGKVPSSIQNFTGGMMVNATNNGTFVGASTSKCQQLITTFRPKKLEICIPGNETELWQCSSALANCTDKTASASRVGYNETLNVTRWQVPAEWGC